MMAAKKPVKKVAKKAAPKKAAPKKVVAKKAAPKPVARKAAPAPKAAPPAKRKVIRSRIGKSPVAKGGIFPWITNKPGSKRSAPPSPPPPRCRWFSRLTFRSLARAVQPTAVR